MCLTWLPRHKLTEFTQISGVCIGSTYRRICIVTTVLQSAWPIVMTIRFFGHESDFKVFRSTLLWHCGYWKMYYCGPVELKQYFGPARDGDKTNPPRPASQTRRIKLTHKQNQRNDTSLLQQREPTVCPVCQTKSSASSRQNSSYLPQALRLPYCIPKLTRIISVSSDFSWAA